MSMIKFGDESEWVGRGEVEGEVFWVLRVRSKDETPLERVSMRSPQPRFFPFPLTLLYIIRVNREV